jgi:hypothetical protein
MANFYLKAEILRKAEISSDKGSYYRITAKISDVYNDANGVSHPIQRLETLFASKEAGDKITVANGRLEFISIRESKAPNGKRYRWLNA